MEACDMNSAMTAQKRISGTVWSSDSAGGWLDITNFSSPRYIVQTPCASWRDPAIARFNELGALQNGWDGYGSGPVLGSTIHFALSVLDKVCQPNTPIPAIVPGSEGDLQIEWHTADTAIELHVIAPNRVHAWRRNRATGTSGEEFNLSNDFTVVANWIRYLPVEQQLEVAAAQ
jgi:hypothetical protein